MSTGRLETFADGVFAIAATLLILNVDAQIPENVHDLGAQILDIWPSYLAYAVSFVTIGIMWINHHTMMDQIKRADRRFLIATDRPADVHRVRPVPDEDRRRAHSRRGRSRTRRSSTGSRSW